MFAGFGLERLVGMLVAEWAAGRGKARAVCFPRSAQKEGKSAASLPPELSAERVGREGG